MGNPEPDICHSDVYNDASQYLTNETGNVGPHYCADKTNCRKFYKTD